MGTLIFILSFIVCVIAWDLFARLRFLFVRRRYADFWNDFFRMMSRFCVLLARVYAGLRFIRESAVPSERLPERFLLVTNHQSLADIAILVCAFPGHDLKYAAKKELKYGIPSVSLGLRLGNHAFVNRRGGFGETMRSLSHIESTGLSSQASIQRQKAPGPEKGNAAKPRPIRTLIPAG